MIVFHLFFYIDYFNIQEISMYSGGWLVFQRSIAFLFLALAGVSVVLYFAKHKSRLLILKRGFIIFLLGMLITLFTFAFFREDTVVFGILHLIGFSVMMSVLFFGFGHLNLILGLGVIFAGLFVSRIVVSYKWLVWLGFVFRGFQSFDYYPLLPWFGLVLIGLSFGNLFYKNRERGKALSFLPEKCPRMLNKICFLGRHSLLIYFIHIPVLFGLVWLVSSIV